MWDIVPHRESIGKSCAYMGGVQLSTNCVTSSLSYQGPTMPVGPPYANLPRGAPHGHPRGPAWSRGPLPRGRSLCAFCAPRGPPTALPRGLSAASHPCGGPARHVSFCRWACSPRQHLQVINPFFCDFSKGKIK